MLTNGFLDLRFMWECYTNILRTIHSEGQIRGDRRRSWIYEPYNELGEMMRTYLEQLERIENERLGGHDLNNK